MKKLIFFVAFASMLSSCGYDGHYRYECQDPVNWEDPNCHPPICNVDGMCTKNLIGFDPRENPTETTEPPTQEEQQPQTTEETIAP